MSIHRVVLSAPQLRATSLLFGTTIFWAGARSGYRYQFARTRSGDAYVRYLPSGAAGKRSLIVATYPFPDGFRELKLAAEGKAVAGDRGSVFLSVGRRPGRRTGTDVLMAFLGAEYQIEIYDPRVGVAQRLASSGRAIPVLFADPGLIG